MRLIYNNLDGNIRRLFFISNWQAGIKSSLYYSAVCYYHLGAGVKPQDDTGEEPGNLFILYIYIFSQMIYTESESKRLGSGL